MANPKRRWHATAPLAVLLLGALAVILVLWTSRVTERAAVQQLLLEDAIRGLEVAVSKSHLWLEEALTGDASIEVEAIWQQLDGLMAVTQQLIRSDAVADATDALLPLEDPELRKRARGLRWQLIEFRDLSVERYRQGSTASAGSPLDQSFDENFEALLEAAEALRQAAAERAATSRRAAQRRLSLLVLSWGLLVAAAAVGLWRGAARRHRAEASLRESRRLRRRSQEALRRREAELLQAQKMEAVGRLAGGIAHDINNYLGALQGYCETVRLRYAGDAQLTAPLEAATRTVARASALIGQLLAFSRRQPLQTTVIDLNRVVERTDEMMRRLLPQNIGLAMNLEEGLWSIRMDPSQIEQILVNLLINSRDAMPEGGEIEVRTRRAEKAGPGGGPHPALAPGRYVQLSVRDTGTGIPPEIKQRIFEPYFTTKLESGSSGLGLSTVQGIVRNSGGFLAVSSSPGAGTSFDIFLPASTRQMPEPEPADEALAPSPSATILLVDPCSDLRASTEGLLSALGHRVLAAASAEEALAILDAPDSTVDLLITDVVMAGINGPTLLHRVREKCAGVGCLFMSGSTETVVLPEGLVEERSDFLQKPFSAAALSQKIAGILSGSTAVTTDAASQPVR